jgi:hypothetical protein
VSSPNDGASRAVETGVTAIGDVIALAGIVFCIPFVILAIGIPIALVVQLLLWVGRLF